MSEDTQKKELPKGTKRIVGATAALITLIVGGFYLHNELKYQSTEDAYVESHMIQIAPKVGGEITEVYIKDNQYVKEGDVIAKIEDKDYKIKFEKADAKYQKALLAQNVAKANLTAVNSEIALAKKDLERYKELYATGAVSKQVLDNAQTKYDTIAAKKTNVEESILTQAQKSVADADLKELKADRDKAALDLERTKVLAPNSGTVTNKRIEKGAFVQTGQPLFVLVPKEVWIVANFKENQVGQMKPGQEVTIQIDTYKGVKFKGKIDSIQRSSGAKSSLFPPENAVGSFVKIVQRIPVKIVFDKDTDFDKYTIVAGMSVIPKVKIK